jgi:predicted dehydrogenase
LLEASWTQIGGEPAFAMIVYGERGTLIVHQAKPAREGERVGVGRVQVVTSGGSRDIDPPALPPEQRDGPTHFLRALSPAGAVTPFCAADVGCDVQEVIAAAQRSSASSRGVRLPFPHGA